MRISDWSSDVCSSDLREKRGGNQRGADDVERGYMVASDREARVIERLGERLQAAKHPGYGGDKDGAGEQARNGAAAVQQALGPIARHCRSKAQSDRSQHPRCFRPWPATTPPN